MKPRFIENKILRLFCSIILGLIFLAVPLGTLSATSGGNGASNDGVSTPKYGGIYRIVTTASPDVLGYAPDMDPKDFEAVLPIIERLMDTAKDRSTGNGFEPVLCESVEDNVTAHKLFSISGRELNSQMVQT